MADPPQTPQPPQPLVATFNPYATVNLDEARKQKDQYGADLEKTRGALSAVQGQRMDVTTRNLAAIDESIKGLQDSRTGTYGLDPAVTAALAAGFLKPGGGGGFMGELGNAMSAAAPVVGSLQKQDRDSFQILADLQRKRGEFEAEPYKEQQTELSAREKLEFANLKEAEKALARAPTAATTEKPLDRQKFIEDLRKNAEAEIKQKSDNKMRKSTGEPLNETDAELIRNYVLRKRIEEYNRLNPGAPLPLPQDDIERDKAKALLDDTTDVLKGKDLVYYRYKLDAEKRGEKPQSQEVFEASDKGRAANEVEVQKNEATTEANIPKTLQNSDAVLENVDQILNHKGLDKVVDQLTGGIVVMSRDGQDFMRHLERLKGQAFVQGIAALKNTGPVSNAEGEKVQNLMGIISPMMHPEEFRKAMREIKESVTKIKREQLELQEKFKQRREQEGRKPAISSGGGGGKPQGSGPGGAWAIGDRWTDGAGRKLIVAPDGSWVDDK